MLLNLFYKKYFLAWVLLRIISENVYKLCIYSLKKKFIFFKPKIVLIMLMNYFESFIQILNHYKIIHKKNIESLFIENF